MPATESRSTARPATSAPPDEAPLVMHLMHRFATGGLENGVVNLINRMPVSRFRHLVVAVTEVVPTFAQRIVRPDVQFAALHKPPGQGLRVYPALWRLIRQHRPAILHSRNLGALEFQVVAAAARVPVRLHGEHGRDLADPQGTHRGHQRLRRLYDPFVHHYIALSGELRGYLVDRVGVAPGRVTQIINGVDPERFAPRDGAARSPIAGCPFRGEDLVLIGTVGRLSPEKHQTLLARAFVRLVQQQPALRDRARLVIVGEGRLRAEVEQVVAEAGLQDLVWLAGERQDVPDVMRGLDLFVLPSVIEGISNTILEAMAAARPVIATDVGGNAELIEDGVSGLLVQSDDPAGMAQALGTLVGDAARRQSMGQAGRQRVLARFSLQAMVQAYGDLYGQQLQARSR